MRNEKEYTRSEETVQVDHARWRMMRRFALAGAILIVISAFVYNNVSSATETAEGQRGFMWGVILILSIQLFMFLWYVAAAYTPFFKVMPKGEIIKSRNWGKSKKRLDRAA